MQLRAFLRTDLFVRFMFLVCMFISQCILLFFFVYAYKYLPPMDPLKLDVEEKKEGKSKDGASRKLRKVSSSHQKGMSKTKNVERIKKEKKYKRKMDEELKEEEEDEDDSSETSVMMKSIKNPSVPQTLLNYDSNNDDVKLRVKGLKTLANRLQTKSKNSIMELKKLGIYF